MLKILQSYNCDSRIRLDDKARAGTLPDKLYIPQITYLWAGDDENKRQALDWAISLSVRNKHLNADVVSNETIHIPDTNTEIYLFRDYLIHRDDFKAWLVAKEEWPLPPEALLSKWFCDEKTNNRGSTKKEKSALLWSGARELAREIKKNDDSVTLEQIAESNEMNRYLSEAYKNHFGRENTYALGTIVKSLRNLQEE
jgi:hypothetical protein